MVGHDKKRAGSNVKFVFARAVGRVETQSIALSELRTRPRARRMSENWRKARTSLSVNAHNLGVS